LCVGQTELAYAASDGFVGLVKITQSLCSAPSSSGFSLDYTIQTRVEKLDIGVFQPDNTGINALSWVSANGNVSRDDKIEDWTDILPVDLGEGYPGRYFFVVWGSTYLGLVW
jgi:hypothetical protein